MDLPAGLNEALNEATFHAAEFDEAARRVGLTLDVVTLPEDGPMPEDRTRLVELSGVGRILASYRRAAWDDDEAPAVPLTLAELADTVTRILPSDLYGWQFIDVPHSRRERWWSRPSTDVVWDGSRISHSIDVFKEDVFDEQHLDLVVWFDELRVFDRSHDQIDLERFVSDGVRWWDAMYAGDPRTNGLGIGPIRPE